MEAEVSLACVACPHTKTPQGHFGASLFHLVHCVIYLCITHTLVPYFVLWTSPRVTRQVGRWPHRLVHGTGYKLKLAWPLCWRHVTRCFNYPATLIYHVYSCLTLDAVTITDWRSGRGLHPDYINKAT